MHVHWSLAKPNVEFLGRELTTSLVDLERVVQRERPDLSSTLAPDGTVTIVFTDIVDSTVTLRRLGDQAWVDVIRTHNAVIAATTIAHGGTVVETQGDGSMLAFSSSSETPVRTTATQLGPSGLRLPSRTGRLARMLRSTSEASSARARCGCACASGAVGFLAADGR